jgi:hypothetical protein
VVLPRVGSHPPDSQNLVVLAVAGALGATDQGLLWRYSGWQLPRTGLVINLRWPLGPGGLVPLP